MTLPEYIKEYVAEWAKERGLKKKEIEEFLKFLEEYIRENAVDPWEAIGIVTAQSLGEPATQATLRTFHMAGSAEVSVASGMDRILEIVDGLKKIQTPVMYVYLNPPYNKDEEKAREFARSLEEIIVSDIAVVKEDFVKKTITIVFNKKEIERRGVDIKAVIKKIEGKVKGSFDEKKYVYKIQLPKDMPLMKMRKLAQSLERLQISGLKGIKRALVKKEGDEFIITTSGTNLKAILKKKEVDHTRTYSNNIHEVAEVLGIEAARYLIIEELYKAYMGAKLLVDKRHLALVADAMTARGVITPIGRTGIAGRKGSVLARAAFEETNKHLVEASAWNEVDHLKGIVENLIVGLPIKAGTGRVKLKMKLR
ncbi:MAG: DNA-directed RNA polymerase subunit A'' [Candidatus Diapherotrites archaeon]|nr:DNA-directed RNA polymerase subunit A'' [Candidatus Diapherotrites archaeon]